MVIFVGMFFGFLIGVITGLFLEQEIVKAAKEEEKWLNALQKDAKK
jgi:hypothetical protein